MSFSRIKIHDYEMRFKALAERSTCFLLPHVLASFIRPPTWVRHSRLVIYDDATRFNWKIDGISYIAPIFGIVKEQRLGDVWNTICKRFELLL